MQQSPDRARLIRLVHVAKRELRLEDDAYRAILSTVIGKNSTADMEFFELKRLVEHLKKCGFKVKGGTPRSQKKDIALDQHAQSRMIRALWLQLAGMGIVRDSSEAALGKWIKRETGIEALVWLDGEQASSCIEKLKKWNHRVVASRRQAFIKAWGIHEWGPLRDAIFKMARKHLGHGADLESLTKEQCATLLKHRLEADYE
ncbi:MAG: hypothetical protein CL536_04360 [Alcaligenaceae bacterium]|nr:hypothetical protein [Alcaligenaceae bacterium]